jgi:hypothetical protein
VRLHITITYYVPNWTSPSGSRGPTALVFDGEGAPERLQGAKRLAGAECPGGGDDRDCEAGVRRTGAVDC